MTWSWLSNAPTPTSRSSAAGRTGRRRNGPAPSPSLRSSRVGRPTAEIAHRPSTMVCPRRPGPSPASGGRLGSRRHGCWPYPCKARPAETSWGSVGVPGIPTLSRPSTLTPFEARLHREATSHRPPYPEPTGRRPANNDKYHEGTRGGQAEALLECGTTVRPGARPAITRAGWRDRGTLPSRTMGERS